MKLDLFCYFVILIQTVRNVWGFFFHIQNQGAKGKKEEVSLRLVQEDVHLCTSEENSQIQNI